jgi:phosphoglucosamine mutase
LGAQVITINNSPNGKNINYKSGSTHPEELQSVVKATNSDLGFAFDGDADRCLAVDSSGNLISGDKILALIAKYRKDNNLLTNNIVVVTEMTNKGFINAMNELDISVEVTGVGDRYVLERMLEKDCVLGGEQSGHVINLDIASTGDGLLTALIVSAIIKKSNSNLKDETSFLKILPQTLINVSDVDKLKLKDNKKLAEIVKKVEDELSDSGRVSLRASGTEPLVRVMVEARTQEIADEKAEEIAKKVKELLKI